MIHIRVLEHKGKFSIAAIADHQKDLNNLRLLSYSLFKKDKITLNKDEFGGPYLKIDCEKYQNPDGSYDKKAIHDFAEQLTKDYN